MVLDNYTTRKWSNVKAWLARPSATTCISPRPPRRGLNLVERWFRELTNKAIRRGVLHSVPDLIGSIEDYMKVITSEPLSAQKEHLEMEACSMRLGRLFHPETKRALVVAFDRGLGADASGGGEDPSAIISAVDSSGAEGVLVSPGILDRHRHLLAHRHAPAVLLRSDFIFMGQLQPEGLAGDGEEYRVLVSGPEAAAMGADAVVLFLILGYRSDATTADNAQAVARTAREAHAVGLPVIVETVLWGSRAINQADASALKYACRLAAELGADAVKTQYTGDVTSMREVITSCPVPVLLLGGPKVDTEEDLVNQTTEALSTGARGLVYGRNVWQSADPSGTATQLHRLVHESPAS